MCWGYDSGAVHTAGGQVTVARHLQGVEQGRETLSVFGYPRAQGTLAMSGDIFGERDATGIEWVGARDALKHPTVHRTAPTTKIYPTQCQYV